MGVWNRSNHQSRHLSGYFTADLPESPTSLYRLNSIGQFVDSTITGSMGRSFLHDPRFRRRGWRTFRTFTKGRA